MPGPYARVIADSTYAGGPRVTTLEVRFHRFVLSEFNTHRVFSRNSASSRAIPITKQVARLTDDPALPTSWPAEQPGMQGGAELDDDAVGAARDEWTHLAKLSVDAAARLREIGLHKSVTNRLLEPFMWHTVVVTSTAWSNFFAQRSNPLAQPEIREVSELMESALADSTPAVLGPAEWHLPYVSDAERAEAVSGTESPYRLLTRLSAARCARTSYLTQDGVRDVEKDVALYDRLVGAQPAHWSPLEHVATPWPENRAEGSLAFRALDGAEVTTVTDHLPRVGNLLAWRSLRTEVESAQAQQTFA